MIFKVLVCLLPLLCSQVWSLTVSPMVAMKCDEVKKREIFKCDDRDAKKVSVFGQNFTCLPTEMCNRLFIEKEAVCSPCIAIKEFCDGVFTCVDATPKSVTIGKSVLTCPKGYQCNKEMKETCDPCIKGACDPMTWQCKDATTVIIGGLVIKCPTGQICNKDNVFPCDPCIIKPTYNKVLPPHIASIFGIEL